MFIVFVNKKQSFWHSRLSQGTSLSVGLNTKTCPKYLLQVCWMQAAQSVEVLIQICYGQPRPPYAFFSLHVLYALRLLDLYFGKNCSYYIQIFTVCFIVLQTTSTVILCCTSDLGFLRLCLVLLSFYRAACNADTVQR